MDRSSFYERIRTQVAKARDHVVTHAPPGPPGAGYAGGGDDLGARFLDEWKAVGGQGEIVPGAAELKEKILEICVRHQVRRVIAWDHELLNQLKIFPISESIESRCFSDQAAAPSREWSFSADLGITSVDWAIAETGSLAVVAKPNQPRLVSLLPPVHVTVLSRKQLIPDLFDLFAHLKPDQLSSNVTLITGPSKTGDIQLKLTTGVHGPGHVYALIVENV